MSIYFYSYTKRSAKSILSCRTEQNFLPSSRIGEPNPVLHVNVLLFDTRQLFSNIFEQTFAGLQTRNERIHTWKSMKPCGETQGNFSRRLRGATRRKLYRTISRRFISHGGGEFTKRITKASYELRRNSQPEFN